jgi:aryl-alcohol dehydrogenase-like predicted oxidoreductase
MPLAVGLLTGRYRVGQIDAAGRLAQEMLAGELLTDRNLDQVEKLLVIAERKGCTLAQLAIAWLLAREVTASVIAGVTNMAHLEDNVCAADVTLAKEELAAIDALTGSTDSETG